MKQVDWTPRVELRCGIIGKYIGECAITGKHRVQTFKNERGQPIDPPTPGDNTQCSYTTWLLDDSGRCRGDLAPSDQDYAGPAT